MRIHLLDGLTTMLFILLPFHAMAQESDKTAITNTNEPAQSEIIIQATQSVYDSLYALSPKFKKCYSKALKAENDGRPLNYTDGRIDLEYDENGIIYWKYAPRNGPKEQPRGWFTMTDCYKSTLPKSFDIHLEEVVKDFPDNVQKFGRLRFLYNPKSDKVEIVKRYTSPIGTTHNDKEQYRLHDINKHYDLWLKKRSDSKN